MGKCKGNELSTITSSELSSVIYSPLGETIKNPFSRQILLIWVRVAGIRYRENINELLSDLKVGDEVLLVREPENEHDDLAIMIQNEDKEKLGYVPRANNEILARMMDAGLKLSGKVSKIKDPEDGEYPWDAISIDIFLDENGTDLSVLSEKRQNTAGSGLFARITGLVHSSLGGSIKPLSREIFLTNIPAVDTFKIENLQRLLCRMKVGDRVKLRRETDNDRDEMAIVVFNKRNRKLGYIPRSHNMILARLMDAGKHIYAVAAEIEYRKDDSPSHNRLILDIYMED